MIGSTDVKVLGFGWAYPLIGLLFVFLGAAFPLLMWWNGEAFDGSIVAALVVMAVGGGWSFLYLRSYRVRIQDDGFVLSRLWVPAREVLWSSVVAVRVKAGNVIFETTDGRALRVSGQLPDVRQLLAVAEERLPQSAWRVSE
jgi:hypothetical protein